MHKERLNLKILPTGKTSQVGRGLSGRSSAERANCPTQRLGEVREEKSEGRRVGRSETAGLQRFSQCCLLHAR
jgi:hypothetical protein